MLLRRTFGPLAWCEPRGAGPVSRGTLSIYLEYRPLESTSQVLVALLAQVRPYVMQVTSADWCYPPLVPAAISPARMGLGPARMYAAELGRPGRYGGMGRARLEGRDAHSWPGRAV